MKRYILFIFNRLLAIVLFSLNLSTVFAYWQIFLQPEDRRERLREHLARLGISDGFPAGHKDSGKIKRDAKDQEDEAYLTEGPPDLKAARLFIASYSIPRARSRITSAKRKRETASSSSNGGTHPPAHDKAWMKASFGRFVNATSEIGDERPLVSIAFAPNSRVVATGAWSGLCKLWSIDALSLCRHSHSLRGHTERIHDLAFHPKSTINLEPTVVNFATCASDKTAKLWSLQSDDTSTTDTDSKNPISYLSPLATLTGHIERVNGVGFHPSGRYTK